MQWKCDGVVTLADIDALREQRKTDQLTRFSPLFPLAFLALSLSIIAYGVYALADSGVTFSNMFSHEITIAGKNRSIYPALVLFAIFIWLGGWMVMLLLQWARRAGKAPLAVTEQHVCFDGRIYQRDLISHFEQQHWGIHGVFAMIMQDGRILRMPNAAMFGAPVREFDAKVKAEIWDNIKWQLFLAAGTAIGAILIMVLLTST